MTTPLQRTHSTETVDLMANLEASLIHALPYERQPTYLVRLGAPSTGDTIHRSTCRVAARAKGPALRWNWADNNPTVDWTREAPWLHACKVCKPPAKREDL